MKLDILDDKLQKVGTMDVPDDIFAVKVNKTLLWEQVKAQSASRRAGTHATKTRAQVAGGGAKPYKQKGTGRARQGSSRAPNHVGGGCVFGPKPRDYSYRLPRSQRRAALRSALSLRQGDHALMVVERLTYDKPSTRAAQAFFASTAAQTLLVVDEGNQALKLSTRNLPQAKFIEAEAINVFDIIRHQKMVITKQALQIVIAKAQGATNSTAQAA